MVHDIVKYKEDFERLIMNISTAFVNYSSCQINEGINKALREIGEFADVDRSYVFQFYDNGMKMDNTHEWCREGIEPQIDNLKGIPLERFPWITEKYKLLEVVHIPRVADLPPESHAEKKEFEAEGVQSLINVPMVCGRSLVGFLGFDLVREEKTWSDDSIALVRIIGEIFANALGRKHTEDVLKLSEVNYRAIFNSANDAIFVHDIDTGAIFDVNQKMCEMYGYTQEEAQKINIETISEGKSPYTQQEAVQWIQKAAQGEPQLFEWKCKHKNGRLFWVEVNLKRATIGGYDRMLAIVRDITDRKKAEEALTLSEINYHAIFNSANDAIFVHDIDTGAIIDVNQKMCEMYGYTQEETTKINVEALSEGILPYTQNDALQWIKKATEGEPQLFERKAKHKDGHLFWVEVNLKRAIIGGHERLLAIVRDITERKKVDLMKDNILRDVSHTLKTPSAMIEMAYDRIEKGIKNNDMKTIRMGQNIIRNNIKHLHLDTDNILKFFALHEKGMVYEKESVSLMRIITDIIERQQYLVEQKNLTVHAHIASNTEMIYVNREDIEVLLRNIIDNAIKFTEKGSVEMTTHMDNESVVVTVIDTGCGIASKDKDKIFDKFYKRHVAVPGTGLGLAICKEIVKKYGGTIDVVSEGVNKGTTVTFILPKGGQ